MKKGLPFDILLECLARALARTKSKGGRSTVTAIGASLCLIISFTIPLLTGSIRDCGSNLYVGMRVVEMF